MSLINQMLRDLESRNTTNNAPSALQQNIHVTQAPSTKMPLLIWSLLAIIATGGTYWMYQYSKTLTKTPPAIVADNVNKNPVPVAPFEQVLAAPNAVADTAAPKIEPKPPENATTPPIQAAQAIPAAKATPMVQPAPVVQIAPTVQ
ncbi:MAG TPA: hypothetical protein VIE65_03380, partial [Methylobacter sp.]